MDCFVTIVNQQTDKRIFIIPLSIGTMSYQQLRSVIVADESAPAQLRSSTFEFCLQFQQFYVPLPLEQESNAQIAIANNLKVYVKVLDNQQPAANNNSNNVNSGALSAQSAATSGPVTTTSIGGTTVSNAPSITGQSMVGPSNTITGPTITGPTININIPQHFQQMAPMPTVVQALVKKVGLGSTTQPAIDRPGAKVPDMKIPRTPKAEVFQITDRKSHWRSPIRYIDGR
jgi:hypothetical protein